MTILKSLNEICNTFDTWPATDTVGWPDTSKRKYEIPSDPWDDESQETELENPRNPEKRNQEKIKENNAKNEANKELRKAAIQSFAQTVNKVWDSSLTFVGLILGLIVATNFLVWFHNDIVFAYPQTLGFNIPHTPWYTWMFLILLANQRFQSTQVKD